MTTVLVSNKAYTCFEAQVAGVLAARGLDHRWISVRSWGFGYRSPIWDRYSSVGERLSAGIGDLRRTIADFFGYSFTEVRVKDLEAGLEIVVEALQHGDGIILTMDSYWCPWDPGYQKHHQPHFVVVTEVDVRRERLICVDHFFGKTGVELPFANWARTLRTAIRLQPTGEHPLAGDDILRCIVSHVVSPWQDPFSQMDEFARAIAADAVDLDIELNGYGQTWWSAPLFRKLRKVAAGRQLTAEALSGLGSHPKYADELAAIGSAWHQVRLMVLKSAKSRESASISARTAALIQGLRDREATLAETLRVLAGGMGVASGDRDRAVYVDLSDQLNRRGFGCVHQPADVDDTGGYLLVDDLPATQITEVAGRTFKLPELRVGRGDHLRAEGQDIQVPVGRYVEVAFLAAAHTVINDRVGLMYGDETRAQVPIALPSWRDTSDAPVLVDIARRGPAATDALWWEVGGLRTIVVEADPLRELVSINLPVRPELRIFAVAVRRKHIPG